MSGEGVEMDGGQRPMDQVSRQVSLVRADTVSLRPIRWLWQDWLAAGKFQVLAGQPGTGKTTIALAFAATVSTGGVWPDGSHAAAAEVLIWSGEDDPQDTLAPRLLAMGADMSRVHFVGVVREGASTRPFDPARDIEPLLASAGRLGRVALLVVDPVVSAINADDHKNGAVRRSLQPLVDLAVALDCAVLGIHHLSKGSSGRDPVERVTGSLAFAAVARAVLIAAKLPENQGEGGGRLLTLAKSNIGKDVGAFAYDLEEVDVKAEFGVYASRVVWQGAIAGTARELLAQAEPIEAHAQGSSPDRTMTEDAEELLQDLLSQGPVEVPIVLKSAREVGIERKPIRTARKRLGIQSKRVGFGPGAKTYWSLPGGPCLPSACVDAPDQNGAAMAEEGIDDAFGDHSDQGET